MHRSFMLTRMNGARMWWPQSISGPRDGNRKRNHLLHSQIIVINTHIHRHLLDTDRHYFAACRVREIGSLGQQSDAIILPFQAFNGIYCSVASDLRSSSQIPMFSLGLCVLGTLSLWLSVLWPGAYYMNERRLFMGDLVGRLHRLHRWGELIH